MARTHGTQAADHYGQMKVVVKICLVVRFWTHLSVLVFRALFVEIDGLHLYRKVGFAIWRDFHQNRTVGTPETCREPLKKTCDISSDYFNVSVRK